MKNVADTIAAISTAPGLGGIAVIRVSGPESIAVADRIFKCTPPLPSQRTTPALIFGRVVSRASVLDEALLLIMRAPRSYTREDVIELQCHGGNISAKRILRAVLGQKVRLAEPGEFTKRAFVNGRIDLLQAEAVMDLIGAQTERSAKLAMEQLLGNLSNSFGNIYSELLGVCADLEATLDFVEGELPDSFMPSVIDRLNDLEANMDQLLSTWDEGHILREGALVVISGKPNVGKSTLLNALLGRDRVIVSPIPGTTRDVIEEQFAIDGIPIRLTDTAGLRSSECSLEQEGVRRAKTQIEKADVNLCLIDSSRKIDEDDYKHVISLDPRKTIVVFNKIDLGFKVNASIFKKYQTVRAQSSANKGLTEIKQKIIGKLGIKKSIVHNSVISERHRQILIASKAALKETIEMLKSPDDALIVPAASNLKRALDGIARIIGKQYHRELLDSIFTRFCIGK